MKSDFTATIAERSPRSEDWKTVFGTKTIALKHPIPQQGNFPEVGIQEFYEVDLKALTEEQRERMIAHIAKRFHLAVEEVRAGLDKVGCPILAEDVTITIHNPMKWL